jgi:hypothetical protein
MCTAVHKDNKTVQQIIEFYIRKLVRKLSSMESGVSDKSKISEWCAAEVSNIFNRLLLGNN